MEFRSWISRSRRQDKADHFSIFVSPKTKTEWDRVPYFKSERTNTISQKSCAIWRNSGSAFALSRCSGLANLYISLKSSSLSTSHWSNEEGEQAVTSKPSPASRRGSACSWGLDGLLRCVELFIGSIFTTDFQDVNYQRNSHQYQTPFLPHWS